MFIELFTAITITLGPPMDGPPVPTIELSTIPDVDGLPICHVEDCSDVPNQIGMWEDRDTGNWYYSEGEQSFLVVDDTATPVHGHP